MLLVAVSSGSVLTFSAPMGNRAALNVPCVDETGNRMRRCHLYDRLHLTNIIPSSRVIVQTAVVGKFPFCSGLQAPHATPLQGNHDEERILRNDICFTHVAQCCRYAFSTFRLLAKTRWESPRQSLKISARRAVQQSSGALFLFRAPAQVTFNLNLYCGFAITVCYRFTGNLLSGRNSSGTFSSSPSVASTRHGELDSTGVPAHGQFC